VRWWLHTDPPCLFSVDNASVNGMDYSMLDPNLYMVQWTDGKGEIEYQVDINTNDNGLRESFFDVTPYVPFFKQFLQKIPLLTLEQAQKVQIDLIKQLYDCKRQMPYHYSVAAGDYWWDASDATMSASTAGGLQNTIAKVNAVITQLNTVMPTINTAIIDKSNTSFTQVVNGVNGSVIDKVNSNVNLANATLSVYNDNVGVTNSGLLRTTLATIPDGSGGFTDIHGAPGNASNALNPSTYPEVALPGYISATGIPSYISWTPITPVSTSNAQWIPIGGTTPVTVTPAEQQAIMSGIAARTNQLNLVKNSKSAEVAAMTNVYDVINYDVTTGWPVIPLPPGFDVNRYFSGNGGSVNFVGTTSGGGGTGIPEAPSDNVTYGRRNMTWNPALALSGDVLDGGTF